MKNLKFIFLTTLFTTTSNLILSMEPKEDLNTLCANIQTLKLDNSWERFIQNGSDLIPLIASSLPSKYLEALRTIKIFRKALLTPSTISISKEPNEIMAVGSVYNLLDQNIPDESFLEEQYLCQQIQSLQKRNPIIPLKRLIAKGISTKKIDFSNNPFITEKLFDTIIKILIKANLHTNIKSILLQNCNLTSIPKSIGHFINLVELDLRDNPQLYIHELQHIQDILPNTILIISIPINSDDKN